MRPDRLHILAEVAGRMTDNRFCHEAWVQADIRRPGPVSTLPPGYRTDIVGALPGADHAWAWYAVTDPLPEPRVVCVPVFAESELWTLQPPDWWSPVTLPNRMLLGVWAQLGQWLEIDNVGLLESLVGPVAEGIQQRDFGLVAQRLRGVAELPEDVIMSCPRHMNAAGEWLGALGV